MKRGLATLIVLSLVGLGVRAEEPPKALREMISQASEHLEKGKFLEFYQLTMHPTIRQRFEQGGMTLEKLAQMMEKKQEVQTVYKQAFAAMKRLPCQMNRSKNEAVFRLPGALAQTKLGPSLNFELYEGKWWMGYK